MSAEYQARLDYLAKTVSVALKAYVPESSLAQNRLFEAMRYSLLSGGKRLRGALLLEFCEVCGGNLDDALPFACALEMIHAYSLIHDDLPCMDNDVLRRGKPTSHIVFGEAMAVLSGDSLLNLAFETMLSAIPALTNPENGVKAAAFIAKASGAYGMAGGQVLDMENESGEADIVRIELTCSLKTGALYTAACVAGTLLAGGTEEQVSSAKNFAENLGLAFQIVDDILDVTSSEAELGKPIGSDKTSGKATFINALGLEKCRKYVVSLTKAAATSLDSFENSAFLEWLANSMASRKK